MESFFKLIAAGPAFFVSAWLLMVFAGPETVLATCIHSA
jgi:hypothetical protein